MHKFLNSTPLLFLGLLMGMGCGEEDQGRNDIIVPIPRASNTTRSLTMTSGPEGTSTAVTQTAQNTATASTTATASMTTPATLPDVVITEVVPYRDPEFRWFELYNTTDREIDLSEWSMSDGCIDPNRGLFNPGTTLPPKMHVQILLDQKSPILIGNSQPELCIFDRDRTRIDQINWLPDEIPFGRSYGRWPGLDSPFYVMDTRTPGAPNAIPLSLACGNGMLEPGEPCDGALRGRVGSCSDLFYESGAIGCTPDCKLDESECVKVQSDVVINEVTSSGDDAIEIYNKGSEPVMIGGYRLGNEFYPRFSPSAYIVDRNTLLPPGAYLVGRRLGDEGGGPRITLEDEISLYNQAGELLDRVVLPKNKAQVSYCRQPDGTGEFKTCVRQTFGASNE